MRSTRPSSSPGRPPAASRRWRSPWPRGSAAQSSMPIPCRSIATCASSPRGRRRKKKRACRTGFTAMSTRRRTIRSGAGAAMSARCSPNCGAGPRADPGRRHRALFQGADHGACGGAAGPCRDPRASARARCRARAWRRADAELHAARSRHRAAADAERPLAHRPRAGSGAGDRAFIVGLASRGPAAADRCARAAKVFLTCEREATGARASRRASLPCWRPARSTR